MAHQNKSRLHNCAAWIYFITEYYLSVFQLSLDELTVQAGDIAD